MPELSTEAVGAIERTLAVWSKVWPEELAAVLRDLAPADGSSAPGDRARACGHADGAVTVEVRGWTLEQTEAAAAAICGYADGVPIEPFEALIKEHEVMRECLRDIIWNDYPNAGSVARACLQDLGIETAPERGADSITIKDCLVEEVRSGIGTDGLYWNADVGPFDWQATMELRWVEKPLDPLEERILPSGERVRYRLVLQQRWTRYVHGARQIEEEWRDVPTSRE